MLSEGHGVADYLCKEFVLGCEVEVQAAELKSGPVRDSAQAGSGIAVLRELGRRRGQDAPAGACGLRLARRLFRV
jgi:hypothetical protein